MNKTELKSNFIQCPLKTLLQEIDPNIWEVEAIKNARSDDIAYVRILRYNGAGMTNEVFVNVECDSLSTIVYDVVEKLFR